MVNATVSNNPVSIQLKNQSTTVPSNETWVVNITVGNSLNNANKLEINGLVIAKSGTSSSHPRIPQFKMTLTGGDTIEETNGGLSAITVQGFVVDS